MKATREEYDAISRLLSEHVNGDDDIRGYDPDLAAPAPELAWWKAFIAGLVITAAVYGLGWVLGGWRAGR